MCLGMIHILNLKKNIECNPVMKNLFWNLVNYVGCKPVLGHLLFCNRLFGQRNQCNEWTRMICFDEKHAQILLILRSFCCSLLDVINSILLLNSFITRGTINYLQIKEGQENLYDVNPLGANHPFLIFLDFMVVSSRICINYLYKSLIRRYKDFALPEHVPILLILN